MLLININPPWQSIFQLNSVKSYLRLEEDHENDTLNMHMQAAEIYAERMINTTISRKNYNAVYTNYGNKQCKVITLNIMPKLQINDVKIGDQLLSSQNYIIQHDSEHVHIELHQAYPGQITINFDGGHENIETIPAELHQAIMHHIAYLYENRGSCIEQIAPQAVSAFYHSIRQIRF